MVKQSSNVQLNEYQDKLGNQNGAIFFHSQNEWAELWITWQQYENLFGYSDERTKLLSDAGGGFFYYVEKHFFYAVISSLCRLSDPPQTGKHLNLTVKRFVDIFDKAEQKQEVENLISDIEDKTEFARDWRNRIISHNDLNLKLKYDSDIKKATRLKVSEAIAAIHALFAFVYAEKFDSDFSDSVIPSLTNEIDMLEKLYAGHIHIKEKFENRTLHKLRASYPDWVIESLEKYR